MMVHVPNLLSGEQVAHIRGVLSGTDWVDGKVTAGAQSAGTKHNLQVPENAPAARALGDMILTALGQNERFTSAALALRVFPPLFNRYDQGMNFGAHIDNAIRFVKDAGADAVKLEGAGRTLTRIGAILDAGIPVMGHVGLTPQSASLAGSYKARGRTAADAKRIFDEARALERAGCFAVVLEAIPAAVAARITETLKIPTIGIGAGASCDGQVLVWHDLLGLTRGHVPRFVKRYADLGATALEALRRYAAEVRDSTFPDESHTYGMPAEELARFESQVGQPRANEPVTKALRKGD